MKPPCSALDLEPGKCSVGCDLGSKQSEITVAHFPVRDRPPHIVRIPFNGGFAHPERPTLMNQSGSNFDFAASYAVVGDKIICGRSSASEDDAFPLKNLLLLYSGITQPEALNPLPGGPDALRAYLAGTIKDDGIRDALMGHFRVLYEMALLIVEELGLEIVRVCLTYPNYLCPYERSSDFQSYTSSHRGLQRKIYGSRGVTMYHISEGQAATAYITQPWSDPLGSFSRRRLWDRLSQIRKEKPVRFFVVDGGSSSLNCQLQSVSYNELGEIIGSQSINDHNWITGVQGGSHVVNYAVRKLITDTLGELPPGELAALLHSFEMQKGGIDWADPDLSVIVLHGKEKTLPIYPNVLRQFFKDAFVDGLEVLRHALDRVIGLGQDFVVIFCGGSFLSKGLRTVVDGIMADAKETGSQQQITIQHVFLGEYDTSWSSAVSAGAALSVASMPRPVDILSDSAAFGLQLLQRDGPDLPFIGENEASSLFCMGGGNTASVTILNSPDTRDLMAFQLICDPSFLPEVPEHQFGRASAKRQQLSAVRQRKKGGRFCYKKIKILELGSKAEERILPPYDLGFSVKLSRLPSGYLRFTLAGADIEALAQGHRLDKPDLVFKLICCRTDKRGHRRPHKLDKKWLLKLTSAPGTSLLEVGDEKEMSLRCVTCLQLINTVSYNCTTCDSFTVCGDCHSTKLDDHDHTHGWEPVEEAFSQELEDSYM